MSLNLIDPFLKFATGGGGAPFYEVLASTTGTSEPITVSGIGSDYKNLMILASGKATTDGFRFGLNFNGSSASDYTSRINANGGVEVTTETDHDDIIIGEADMSQGGFSVAWLTGVAGYGKMLSYRNIRTSGTGAGDTPSRTDGIGSWQNESDAISSVTLLNGASSGDCNPCELVVLGYNPDATSGTQAWTQIASETISSDGDNFSLSFSSTKKYLWIQVFNVDNATGDIMMKFNGTTGNEYAERYSDDFGSDSTNGDKGGIDSNYGATAGNSFHNYWIYNNASLQKLVIYNYTIQNGDEGNAPTNLNAVGKWTNTSNQITSAVITAGGGGFKAGSYAIVWGFDP